MRDIVRVSVRGCIQSAQEITLAVPLTLHYNINPNTNHRSSFLGAVQLDGETYSEPIMYLKIYKKWISMNSKTQNSWAKRAGTRSWIGLGLGLTVRVKG
jgi:hypothetical protein